MVQCISASCSTSSTRWVHRSPEGYINNIHRASLTPASHFISLSGSEEKVQVCVCVCVCVCVYFFISVARRLTWFPRLFQPHIQYMNAHTHTIMNTYTREGDGGNDIKGRQRHVLSFNWRVQEANFLFKTDNMDGWMLIFETDVWTSMHQPIITLEICWNSLSWST